MELIDLGNFYVRGPKATEEEAFLYEDRESGLYCASVYDRKVFCDRYIFYRSNILDFVIDYSRFNNDTDILISSQLSKTKGHSKPEMRSVSQEVFLDCIRSKNHPALDWLLFNQELWAK